MFAEEAGDRKQAPNHDYVNHQLSETSCNGTIKMAKDKLSEVLLDSKFQINQLTGNAVKCKQASEEGSHSNTDTASHFYVGDDTTGQGHTEGPEASRSQRALSIVRNYISELERVASNIETILMSQSPTSKDDSQNGLSLRLSATTKCSSFYKRPGILSNVLSKISFVSYKDLDYKFPTLKIKSWISKFRTGPKKSTKAVNVCDGKTDGMKSTGTSHVFHEVDIAKSEIMQSHKSSNQALPGDTLKGLMLQDNQALPRDTLKGLMLQDNQALPRDTLKGLMLQGTTVPEFSYRISHNKNVVGVLGKAHDSMNICDISDDFVSIHMYSDVQIQSKDLRLNTGTPLTNLPCSREKDSLLFHDFHENIFSIPNQISSTANLANRHKVENNCAFNINNNGNLTSSTPRNFTISSITPSGSELIKNECLNLRRKTQCLKHCMSISGNEVLVFNGSKVYSITQKALKNEEIIGRAVCDMDTVKDKSLEPRGITDTIQNNLMVRKRDLAAIVPKPMDIRPVELEQSGQLPIWAHIDQTKDYRRFSSELKSAPIKCNLTEVAKVEPNKCLDNIRNEHNPSLCLTQSEHSIPFNSSHSERSACSSVAHYKHNAGLNIGRPKPNACSELLQSKPSVNSVSIKGDTNTKLSVTSVPKFMFINNQIRSIPQKPNMKKDKNTNEKTAAINSKCDNLSMNKKLKKNQECEKVKTVAKKINNVDRVGRTFKRWEEKDTRDSGTLVLKHSKSAMVTSVNNATKQLVRDECNPVSRNKIKNATGKTQVSKNYEDTRWAPAIGNEVSKRFSNIKKLQHPRKTDFPVRIRSVLKENENDMNNIPAETRRLTVESPAENLLVQTVYVRPNPAAIESGINIEMAKYRRGLYLGEEEEQFSTVGTRRLICEAECFSSKNPATKSLVIENETSNIFTSDVHEEFGGLVERARDNCVGIDAGKMICAGNEVMEFGGSNVSEKWISSNRIRMIGNYIVIGSAQSMKPVIKMVQNQSRLSIAAGSEQDSKAVVLEEAGDTGESAKIKKLVACDQDRCHGGGDQLTLATNFEDGNNK